jgi:hypothetical protein
MFMSIDLAVGLAVFVTVTCHGASLTSSHTTNRLICFPFCANRYYSYGMGLFRRCRPTDLHSYTSSFVHSCHQTLRTVPRHRVFCDIHKHVLLPNRAYWRLCTMCAGVLLLPRSVATIQLLLLLVLLLRTAPWISGEWMSLRS